MTQVRRTCAGFLGRLAYDVSVALQESIRDGLRTGDGPEALLLLEHDPVYTLGRNAETTDLLLDRGAIAARGMEVHETNRGGKITYHGPGQLVGYPILNLNPDRRDVRRYVLDLQRVLIAVLAKYDIEAHARQQPETGVWVGERKIASLGIHLSKWLTMHGFALNVKTDLDQFRAIVPCGLPDVEMCSIYSLTGRQLPLAEVAAVYMHEFAAVFERALDPLPAKLLEHTAIQAPA